MENRKNLIIAVVLCVGILLVWERFIMPKPQPVEAPRGSNATAVATNNAQPSAALAAPAAPSGSERGKEEIVSLDTPDATFDLSSWGASLLAVHLKTEKFRTGGKGEPLEIIRARTGDEAPFSVGIANAAFSIPANAKWTVVSKAADRVAFATEINGNTITKTFSASAERYRLRLEVAVKNGTAAPLSHQLTIAVSGQQDAAKKGGGMFSYAVASVEEMVCHVNGKVERHDLDNLKKEAFAAEGMVRWIAADERFFTVAAVPPLQPAQSSSKCQQQASNDRGHATLTLPTQTIKAGESLTYPFEIYAGPKYSELLSAVAPGVISGGTPATGPMVEGDAELDRSVNVTFAFLSRPMMATLKAFHKVIGNWGLSIILLTLLVKLITFYPAHKALLSGKRMAKLAPKIAELKEKYGNDRERLGRETMALYKSQGVNVLGGCLPSLIQMPIWIALYSTLSYSVELYRSAFVGYIHDLSAPDPYYILPLVMGVTMFIQMRMAPAGTDPQQQKIMSIMMPIMFTGFQIFLPAGLAVYVLTNYLLGIVHQMVINRLERGPVPPSPLKAAKAT
ncbi:MAG: membrane protein insertase YidC [Deltaproteobacteria bacterium]|nr:membrane protein insertase YidC [Deltaproteobacteria bacterium]